MNLCLENDNYVFTILLSCTNQFLTVSKKQNLQVNLRSLYPLNTKRNEIRYIAKLHRGNRTKVDFSN